MTIEDLKIQENCLERHLELLPRDKRKILNFNCTFYLTCITDEEKQYAKR